MKKSVLLLGGTGAMGNHLVQILKEKDFEVFVSSRSDRKSHDYVTYIKGNAHDDVFLESLLSQRNWDVIVDFMIYSSAEFSNRVDKLLKSCKQYVFLSSSRVYADSSEPIKESSPRLLDVCKDEEYLKTDEYALSKAKEENILMASNLKNWTIIRPYITFSEIRLQLSPQEKELWLYRCLHGRSIVFSEDLYERYTTLTYGYDVAKGIAAIIGQENALGEAFHITVSDSYKWKDIFAVYKKVIKRETGIEPKLVLTKQWERHQGGGYYQIKYDRLFDRRFDNSKIAKFVDVSEFKPTLKALDECITHFIHNQKFKDINWWSEAYKDRITGEWTPLKELPTIKQKIKYMLVRSGIISR